MSSADLRSAMNYVSQEKAIYEALKKRLSEKSLPATLSLTRDTQGMAGTKYKQHHENVKASFSALRDSVSQEKAATMEELDKKITQLGKDLDRLDKEYQTALANERAEAERKAAEARRKREQARNKNK
jgi:septal ring factor EnvC (AmiA/AmiB activator)